MSILTKAKARAAAAMAKKGSLKEAFKNETGAVDLASIMVGIIVLGIIAGVIAAVVFAVIPWSQNNSAKNQLDSVASAESTYIGLSADGAVPGNGTAPVNSYGTEDQLNAAGLGNFKDAGVTITTTAPTAGEGATYTATITSKTGKVYQITNSNTKPTEVAK